MLADMVRQTEEWLAQPILEATEPDATVEFVFEIIHMARAFEYHLGRVAADHDMTALQARFAWIMAATPWAIPYQDLQVALGMSQAGVSQMMSRMRARGLVECDTDTWDMRQAVVTLSAHGREQWERVCGALATVTKELRSAVGPRSVRGFRSHVRAVTALDERHSYFEALRNPLSFLS